MRIPIFRDALQRYRKSDRNVTKKHSQSSVVLFDELANEHGFVERRFFIAGGVEGLIPSLLHERIQTEKIVGLCERASPARTKFSRPEPGR